MVMIECECIKCGKFFIPKDTWEKRLSDHVCCPICKRYSKIIKINGNGD